jgi:hypothetical protein
MMPEKCSWIVLSYLDAADRKLHRLHGLMSCRFRLTLGWLSEFVLLRFGTLGVDTSV